MKIEIKDFKKVYWRNISKQFPYGTRTKIHDYTIKYIGMGLPFLTAFYGACHLSFKEKNLKPLSAREVYPITEEIKSSVLFSKSESFKFILNPS